MKILVIRFSSLGDIILTTPCLRLLKEKYPNSKIYYAVKKKFSGILYKNPEINEVIPLTDRQGILSYSKKIRAKEKFDLVIDLHNSLRSKILSWRIKKKKILRYKKPYLKRLLLVYLKKNLFSDQESIALSYMRELKELSIEPRVTSSMVYAKKTKKTDRLLSMIDKTKSKKIIVVAPGSHWYTKTWPLDRFIEVVHGLLDKTKSSILFLGGDEEKTLGHKLEREFSTNKRVFNQIGKLSLEESAYMLSQSGLLLCNDSGLMHIASAFKIKTVVLFLSTVPEFGFVPFGDYPKKIISKPLKCKPCNHKGLTKCPEKHFECANHISSGEVLESCLGFL